jgi:hypothetical protein
MAALLCVRAKRDLMHFGGPMQRIELQEKMIRAYADLAAALDGLDPRAASEPGLTANWSVKNAVAHIAAWEREGLTQLAEVGENTWTARPMDSASINAFNERAVTDRAGKTMQEVLGELAGSHQEMEQALGSMPDEIEKSSVQYAIIKGIAVNHARHHAAQIQQWRQGLAASAGSE